MSENFELSNYRRNVRLVDEVYVDKSNHGPIIGYASEPLISLVDACKPLIDIVDDIMEYVSISLEHTPLKPVDNLTRDESASIRLYTMEWDNNQSLYYILNNTLKTSDRDNLRPWYKYLKLFLTALVKIPCSPPQTIWRGVKRNIEQELSNHDEVIWWAFSSCTRSLRVLENELYLGNVGNRVLFSIETLNARNIRDHSHFHDEDEILMLPGTYMIVQSEFSPAPDLYVVHLKQKMPKETLLELPFKDACLYPDTERKLSTQDQISNVGGFSNPPEKIHWYKNKWIIISICLLTIGCLLTVILAPVLSLRSSNRTPDELCSLTFAPLVSYTSGDRPPDSIAVGDFNNDGQLDLAVGLHRGNNIGVFYGNHNGTFQSQKMFLSGSNPWSITIADFNNDNQMDIAVSNGAENNVGVLLGNGDENFASQIMLSTGIDPWAIAVGDFNNDNIQDIVAVNHGSNTTSVILGYGNGTFKSQITFPSGGHPYAVAVGHFNNDNQLDIAIVHFGENNVGIYLGYGNGSFYSKTRLLTGNQPNWIAIGDVNNDNYLDIAVINGPDNSVSIFLGHGNGNFSTQIVFSTENNPQSIILADFNKDNQLDIAVTNYASGTLSILIGYGNGNFAPKIPFQTENNPSAITFGDFNNDSNVDIALVNHGSNSIGILLNTCYCCAHSY